MKIEIFFLGSFCLVFGMEKSETVRIVVKNFSGSDELAPENIDISEIAELLLSVQKLLALSPAKDRSLISYSLEHGSVVHTFRTSPQTVVLFNAILDTVTQTNSIDFLDTGYAQVIENFQKNAVIKNYSYSITTSLSASAQLSITPETFYYATEQQWVNAEFYFFGKIINAGGKKSPNIHLLTEEYGMLIIATPQGFLAETEYNLLYKEFVIRAKGRQNVKTGQPDTSSLEFIELKNYSRDYEQQYINKLREQAAPWITSLDTEKFLTPSSF